MFTQNSVRALKTEFEKLSKIMGRPDIRTTFNGSGAYTNNKTINVPEMDDTATMTPKDQAIARGYHIHETGHVTDTDFSLASAKKPSKHLHGIWNACEDVYVERKAIEKFVGAKRSLSATVDSVLESENKHWNDDAAANAARRKTWWTEIPYAALQLARKAAGYESKALDAYVNDIPDDLLTEALPFSERMTGVQNTGESYALAKDINRRMNAIAKSNEEDEPQTDKPQGSTDNPEGQTEEGEGKAQGQGEGQQDDTDNPKGGGGDGEEEGEDDGGKASDTEDGDEDGEGDGEGAKGFSMEDAEDRAKDNTNKVFGKYSSGNSTPICVEPCQMHDTHAELWKAMHQKAVKAGMNNGKGSGIINMHMGEASRKKEYLQDLNTACREQIGSDVRAYAARLARLLLSQESKRNEGGYSSGRIDRRRLSQLVTGNQNIFARTENIKTSETRLMIAIDGSSSMNQQKTMRAIHVVNDGLGRANLKYDVSEWSGLDLDEANRMIGCLPWIVHHKKSHENYRVLQSSLNFQPVGGDTPSYAALLSYADIMSNWIEPRKVLIMLTDGMPNGGWDERRRFKKLVSRMEDSGIEVIGVGIDEDVSRMFNSSIQSDFDELGKTLLGSLEKLLISQGHAHA